MKVSIKSTKAITKATPKKNAGQTLQLENKIKSLQQELQTQKENYESKLTGKDESFQTLIRQLGALQIQVEKEATQKEDLERKLAEKEEQCQNLNNQLDALQVEKEESLKNTEKFYIKLFKEDGIHLI